MTNGNALGDIAIAPNGKIYSLRNGFNTNLEILEVDFTNNLATLIATLPIPTSGSYSLTCSNNFELFALGSNYELWKYNLITGNSSFVANLGSSSPGDITFYKGNIIFQSNNAGNIKVIATYKDGNKTLSADSHMMVTVQKWVNPPIN